MNPPPETRDESPTPEEPAATPGPAETRGQAVDRLLEAGWEHPRDVFVLRRGDEVAVIHADGHVTTTLPAPSAAAAGVRDYSVCPGCGAALVEGNGGVRCPVCRSHLSPPFFVAAAAASAAPRPSPYALFHVASDKMLWPPRHAGMGWLVLLVSDPFAAEALEAYAASVEAEAGRCDAMLDNPKTPFYQRRALVNPARLRAYALEVRDLARSARVMGNRCLPELPPERGDDHDGDSGPVLAPAEDYERRLRALLPDVDPARLRVAAAVLAGKLTLPEGVFAPPAVGE